jgi:hypothetical protein
VFGTGGDIRQIMASARLANFLNPKPDSLAEWKS